MKTILIVDDDEQMRKALRIMLEKHDFEVVEASTGAEAETVYKHDQPALVLMDIVLPKEHGLMAIERIVTADPDARIIGISGLHSEEIAASAREAGVKEYIFKPFDMDEVLPMIRRYTK